MHQSNRVWALVLTTLFSVNSVYLQEDLANLQNSENDVSPINKQFDYFHQDSRTCDYFSTLKATLESSKKAVLLIQDFLTITQLQLEELECINCGTNKISGLPLKLSDSATDSLTLLSSCHEIKEKVPNSKSGIYRIKPKYWKYSLNVYCDFETVFGDWTVIQRRMDMKGNQENFYRGWEDYKNGFGDLNTEFWLGNDVIFALTNQGQMTLRIDMEDFDGVKRYAQYNKFVVSTEADRYRIRIAGYTGDAGNSMGDMSERFFHTFDKTDTNNNCAVNYKGGWWYGNAGCHHANPNGLYLRGNHKSYADGINWYAFRGHNYSLRRIEMKIRLTKV